MILYFETVEIQLRDIPKVLSEMGYCVKTINLQIKAQSFDREKCNQIVEVLQQEQAEYVFSYDFAETIAQACLEADVPYIAWVYDDPQQELYTRYAHYPNNYIFVFDRLQQKRLQQIGLKNVYHMPLAINGNKVIEALQKSEKYAGRYEAEIAFVGQLYRIKSLENIIKQADVDIQAAIERCVADCFLYWDERVSMHETMPQNCVQYFCVVDGHKVEREYPYVSEQFYYEAAVLSRIIANRERLAILNNLAEDYDVRFYTFDKDVRGLNERVTVCSGAKYDVEVSHVYQQSKINLNITLHCIETGICQRVFDVMAAGGFLLTNYQAELEELFVPGEDLVMYHNLEELRNYVAYYLEHEEERLRIAKNGQRKVLEEHDFRIRMQQVLELVAKKERQRTETYIDILYKNEAEIEMMRELIACTNVENKLGIHKILHRIHTMKDAKKIYFEARNQLLTMLDRNAQVGEMVLSDDYRQICQLILEKKIPCLYIVWKIYVHESNIEKCNTKEEILVNICEAMKLYNMVVAIELLSYGLLITPYAPALLLKKAEYLMDINMWKEALDTLKQIKEPQPEIVLLIEELENALRM